MIAVDCLRAGKMVQCGMDRTLESLIDRLPTWPRDAQEQALKSLLAIEAERVGRYTLSAAEAKAVAEGQEQARSGEFVSDEEIEAFFERHDV